MGPEVVVLIFGFVFIIFIYIYFSRILQRREARYRAEERGWTFADETEWAYAPGANFKVSYSYVGTTEGIPWIYTSSIKTTKRDVVGMTGTGGSKVRDYRTDWRTDSVSVPHMVFIKPHPPHRFANRVMSMLGMTTDAYINYVLNLGIIDEDAERGQKIRLNLGGLRFETVSNPTGNLPDTQHHLEEIAILQDDTFEIHALSEEIARQVLNEEVWAALDGWRESFKARFGRRARANYDRHPYIVLHDKGIYMTFNHEERKFEAIEAVVALGTALATALK